MLETICNIYILKKSITRSSIVRIKVTNIPGALPNNSVKKLYKNVSNISIVKLNL